MPKIPWVVLIFLLPAAVGGQHIDVGLIDQEVYPRIKVYALVQDGLDGQPICDLVHEDFRLLEGGEERPFRLLSGRATETSIAILLDESGSMGSVISEVRGAAQRFLDVMSGTDRAATYSFASRTHSLHSMVDVTAGSNREALKRSLDRYPVLGGGTELYVAIEELIDQELSSTIEKERRKAIVALTDGSSSGSLESAIAAAKQARAAVYAIGMGDVDTRALESLTKATGGQFYSLSATPTQDELDEVYQEIRQRLECQYTLIYDSPDVCPDGASVVVAVQVPKHEAEGQGGYVRPLNYAQMDFNLRFATIPSTTFEPPNPVECETVVLSTWLEAESCSATHVLDQVVVNLFDVTQPGQPIALAKSSPVQVRSNSEAVRTTIEWDTRGFLGVRELELVIDPVDDVLERREEDNLQRLSIPVGEQVHDLYIESIEYEPKPAFPCDAITLEVQVADGSSCRGTQVHDIEVAATDDGASLGTAYTTITVGQPATVRFDWEPKGFSGFRPLTFEIDPSRSFGGEQTFDNNTKEALVEVRAVEHDLQLVEMTHNPPTVFVGDTVEFAVRIADEGQCPGIELPESVRVRGSHAENRRSIGQSELFTLRTAKETLVHFEWQTGRHDDGDHKIEVMVDPQNQIREPDPPGTSNNLQVYDLRIEPMPHDLVIVSAALEPSEPRDGDPAKVVVTIQDDARFDGFVLENVTVRVQDRYRGFMVGETKNLTLMSQGTLTTEVEIDTGGLAGDAEFTIVVDPDEVIAELTPEGLDGESNNIEVIKAYIRP